MNLRNCERDNEHLMVSFKNHYMPAAKQLMHCLGTGAYIRTALGNLTFALVILKLFDRNFAKIGLLYVVLAAIFIVISIGRRAKDVVCVLINGCFLISERFFLNDVWQADFADNNVVETSRTLLGRAIDSMNPASSTNSPASASAQHNEASSSRPSPAVEAENEGLSQAQVENNTSAVELDAVDDGESTQGKSTSVQKQDDRSRLLPNAIPVKLPPASKRVWGKRPFRTSGDTVVAMTGLVIGVEVALLVLIFRLPDTFT